MKKRSVILIAVLIIFLIYLLFANQLVLYATGKQHDVIKVNELPEINDRPIFYDFDNTYSLDNLTEEYFIQGWVFCESESMGIPYEGSVSFENLDKKVTLYLISDNNVYKIETKKISRLDIWEVFNVSKNIHGMYHGYNARFSTIGIKDGIYDLYILTEENEHDKAFNICNASFEKKGTRFYKRSNEPVTGIENIEKTDMEFYLDGVYADSGALMLVGWGLSPKLEMKNALKYIQVTNADGDTHIFRSYDQYRGDIVEAYNNNYAMVGYSCQIPLEYLTDGTNIIRLIIFDNNKYYISEKQIELDAANIIF